MGQAEFSYGRGERKGATRRAISMAIYSDQAHLRLSLAEDLEAAGFQVSESCPFSQLNAAALQMGQDIILIDCAGVAAEQAVLEQIGEQAQRAGAQLVVATSLQALDAIYAALSRWEVTLLVDPTRADWVLSIGQVLGRISPGKVREMSDEDRLALLRLAEQVSRIATKLDRLTETGEGAGSAFRFESSGSDYRSADGDGSDRLVRASKPPLPDPRLLRRIIRQRQLRARFFDGDLFADPAWDILLDLTAARAEHLRVSVTSLCIASGVPPTTALRWISQMVDAGLLERVEDETDRRRAFIALTDKAADSMARYFVELGKDAVRTI